MTTAVFIMSGVALAVSGYSIYWSRRLGRAIKELARINAERAAQARMWT